MTTPSEIKDYADPKVLRNEVEGFISAGATNEAIRRELPLTPERLLSVVRILTDELEAFRELRENVHDFLELPAYGQAERYNAAIDALKASVEKVKDL
jgi:hypothetical protein